MEYLSEHFTLAELSITAHRDIDNSPPAAVIPALRDTAEHLELVRRLLAKPILINSGFRCPELNQAVGSKPTSAHMHGRAVDFIVPGYGPPLEVCRAIETSRIPFDQLIMEGSWTHLSFDPRMRRQVLTMKGGRYTLGLPAV